MIWLSGLVSNEEITKRMEDKPRNPTFVYVIALIVAFYLYKSYTNRPVTFLAARSHQVHDVYSGPRVDYEIIGTLPAYSDISLKGRSGTTWVTFSYYGQQGWIQDFFLDIDGNSLRLPEVEVNTEQPIISPRADFVKAFFQSVIADPNYYTSGMQIHNYLDYIRIEDTGNELKFYLSKSPASDEEFMSLAINLFVGSSILSDAGGETDWNLSRIELISTDKPDEYGTLYVSGYQNISAIAEGSAKIYDLIEYGSEGGVPSSLVNKSPYDTHPWEADFGDLPESGCPSGCTYHKDGCDIKGNVAFDSGEKIYHLPSQKYYSETVINIKYGERWFCTEDEAIANGWRKSYE